MWSYAPNKHRSRMRHVARCLRKITCAALFIMRERKIEMQNPYIKIVDMHAHVYNYTNK